MGARRLHHFLLCWGTNLKELKKYLHSLLLIIHSAFPCKDQVVSLLNGNTIKGFVQYSLNLFSYIFADKKFKSGFQIKLNSLYPSLVDRYEPAGNIPRHYFWQDLWAARKVYASKIEKHYDLGSRLSGFIAQCLPFCNIVMLDIRPLPFKIQGLEFIQVDCTNMQEIATGSIPSLSSLHAVEHIGLGRYGDNVDPLGHIQAIKELKRILSPMGNLYFSVPVGIERLEFDSHRIFNPLTIREYFNDFELVEFSIIDDENMFHENVDLNAYSSLFYGCGLFHFRKRKNEI